ncbi:MAG TPA: lipid A-modifier LpxR family protein, partial [Gemmatimonadaceae bacterium]|nr:lipid A-modifier LpxR family protein [Gemmatimonadaceae bacterium]
MMMLRAVTLALWMSLALAPGTVRAQAVPGTEVTGENDALDFWLPQKQRPDGEYTNGLRVSISRSSAPLWGRFFRSALPCTGKESVGQRCLTTEFAIAQQMYTPEPLNHRASQLGQEDAPDDSVISAPISRDRPFAGWLHADV